MAEPTDILVLDDIQNPMMEEEIDEDIPELISDLAPSKPIEEKPKFKKTKFEVANLTAEEKELREEYLWQVDQYFAHFPDELKEFKKPRNLKSMSNPQLLEYVDMIDRTIGTSTSGTFLKELYLLLCKTVEAVNVKRGWLKLQGFHDAVAENEAIDKQLKRLEIKYLGGIARYCGAEAALVSLTVLCALSVHRHNAAKEKTQVHAIKPVSSELQKLGEGL